MDKTTSARRLFVASTVNGKGPGIAQVALDGDSGRMTIVAATQDEHATNPLYIASSPDGSRLYVADFVKTFGDKQGGGIHAYAVSAEDGTLTHLGGQAVGGSVPCYIGVWPHGGFVIAANYGDGCVTMFPLKEDGSLEPMSDRQDHGEGAKAHCVIPSPEGRWALAADLGIDQIVVYAPDTKAKTLGRRGLKGFAARPKSGPRHLAFHPSGWFLYAITEYDNTMYTLSFDSASGSISELQVEPLLPRGLTGKHYGADLHFHPSGKFLYGSNRGHDSIVTYKVDARSGLLECLGHTPTGGSFPRSFVVDPSGRYLLVGNERSNEIASLRIDPATGKLQDTGERLTVASPVSLCWA